MADLVGLPLLKAVAKPMFEVVMGRVKEEMRYIKGFQRDLTDLEKKMRIIGGIVNSMNTDVPNEAVEEWLRDTIRIMRNAEDMVDVLAYENHRIVLMETTPPDDPQYDQLRCCSFLNLLRLSFERMRLHATMGRWIHGINSDIEAVRKKARFIKDLSGFEGSTSTSSLLQPSTVNDDDRALQQVRRHPDTSHFVGRDSDAASVVNMLTNPPLNSDDQSSNHRLSVVAIVGIGGQQKKSS